MLSVGSEPLIEAQVAQNIEKKMWALLGTSPGSLDPVKKKILNPTI